MHKDTLHGTIRSELEKSQVISYLIFLLNVVDVTVFKCTFFFNICVLKKIVPILIDFERECKPALVK